MNRNRFEKKFVHIRILVSSLCVLCVLCVSISAQQWKSVADGVEYAEVRREFSGKSVNINLLRLDLKKVRLDVHHALDAAIGTEKTSSIATRHKAFAAINAGFFRLDTTSFAGDPVGLFMIDGEPLSEAVNDRIQLIISNRSNRSDIQFARMKLLQSVTLGQETFDVTGVNRERKADDTVIYTPHFGPTTKTGGGGLELVIVKGIIISALDGLGNAAIPRNGYVISASGKFRQSLAAVEGKNGSLRLTRRWEGLPAELTRDRFQLDVVTGVPQLIKNSKIDITWEQEKSSKSFVETRHPRTAVAKLKDGKFLMLTADGRSEQSAGLDLYDLAAYFLELGATDAMNLDGGGSTTMFVGGKVVNKPSDKEGERKVGDAILVTLRKKK